MTAQLSSPSCVCATLIAWTQIHMHTVSQQDHHCGIIRQFNCTATQSSDLPQLRAHLSLHSSPAGAPNLQVDELVFASPLLRFAADIAEDGQGSKDLLEPLRGRRHGLTLRRLHAAVPARTAGKIS